MIPIHEIIFLYLKKIPFSNYIKRIPLVGKVAAMTRSKYMDSRRALVSKNGYEIISTIYDISKKLNLCIWIDWGTLLGYLREGKILEHDYDLDFGTWRMDNVKHDIFVQELNSAGFELVRFFLNDRIILTETYEKNGVLFDIEYYWKEGEKAYTCNFETDKIKTKISLKGGIQIIEGMNLYIYTTECVEFDKGEFINGTKCIIPKNIEKKVREMYSENWKVPIKNFSWKDLRNYNEAGFVSNITGWRKK